MNKFNNDSIICFSFMKAMKDTILNKHNELRALVANGEEERGVDGGQPKATNMRELVWCDKLAEVAQRYFNNRKSIILITLIIK